MAIEIASFILLKAPSKTAGNKYRLSGFRVIERWPNDYFDDKLDIFSEKDWADFIVNYRKFGKKLPKVDENGDYHLYCIFARGANRLILDFFGVSPEGVSPQQQPGAFFYLFP